MAIVFGFAPNTVTCCDAATATSDDSTSTADLWTVLASDGTVYKTLANLTAAGKIPFGAGYTTPGSSPSTFYRDPGLFWQILNVKSDNGSLGNSSGFYYAFNQTAAPNALTSDGVEAGLPGIPTTEPGTFSNVWIYKTVNTDRVFLTAKF